MGEGDRSLEGGSLMGRWGEFGASRHTSPGLADSATPSAGAEGDAGAAGDATRARSARGAGDECRLGSACLWS